MEHFYRLSVHFFAFVTFFVALQVRRGFSITEIDSYLANHAMRTVSLGDWLSCTLACHEDTSCISYNYNMKTRSCDLNDYGVLTSVLATDLLIRKRGVVFHQIRAAENNLPRRTVDAASQCDCSCTSESACRPGRDSYDSLPESCKEIWEKSRIRVDGSFFIRAKSQSGYAHVFCHMTPIPGCGDGGWTLVMKLNGSQKTFKYHSKHWTSDLEYNEKAGTNMKEEETKLSSYWSTPFTRLCLGMRDAAEQDTNWISLEHAATSLRDVIDNGNYTATNLTITKWKSLLSHSQIDEQCTKQGFNTDFSTVSFSGKARIGIIGFPVRCNSGGASSRIGFGTEGSWYGMQDSNSCGNERGSTTSKTAFGYIFVQ